MKKMYIPPVSHMMDTMYRNPRPYNNHGRASGPYPQAGFQYRSNRHFRPPARNSTNGKNEEHWCETCDRGFPSVDLLSQHKQQHQKCNIDGCQFVAHPKVITKHIQMQHSTGLYKKIANLTNPEEIEKWREERKKKYPTRSNIEKKAAECKEKIERGEKMALKRNKNDHQKLKTENTTTDQTTGTKRRHNFGENYKHHGNNRANTNQRQNNVNSSNNKSKPPPKKVPKTVPKVPSIIENNKLKPFAGILSINMQDEDKVEDDINTKDCSAVLIENDYYEEPIKSDEQKAVQEPALCGALTSLVCDYGSSDEEPNEQEHVLRNVKKAEPVKTVIKINNKEVDYVNKNSKSNNRDNMNSVPPITETKPSHENSDDDGPEEVKTDKSNCRDLNLITQETSGKPGRPISAKKTIHCRNNNQKQATRYKYKVPSTLLYKLLHKEIRKERNIVLQCIRYIKKMKYFEKAQ